MGAMSLQNAAPGDPVSDNTSGGGANTVDLTTTEAKTFVVGAFTIDAGSLANPPAFTTLYLGNSGSSVSTAGYATEPLPGTYTYTWGTDALSSKQGAIVVAGFAVTAPATAEELYGLTNGTEVLTADPDFGGNPTNSDAASVMPTALMHCL